MAGWLTRRFDCAFWMTRLEYLTCRMLVADTGREAPVDALRFYQAAGWNAGDLEHYKARFGEFGKMVHPLPDSYHRVADGGEFLIGANRWRAVIGRGHSPEHLCLYCPELRVFISGDQVLPKITSNVSVFSTEPDADPLRDWLESLAAIRAAVPDDVCVLPAHNEPFYGLHARIDQLIDGHERSLRRLLEALAEPKTATDVFDLLFRRPVSGSTLLMATGESVAHLNCLVGRGVATVEVDDVGARGIGRGGFREEARFANEAHERSMINSLSTLCYNETKRAMSSSRRADSIAKFQISNMGISERSSRRQS